MSRITKVLGGGALLLSIGVAAVSTAAVVNTLTRERLPTVYTTLPPEPLPPAPLGPTGATYEDDARLNWLAAKCEGAADAVVISKEYFLDLWHAEAPVPFTRYHLALNGHIRGKVFPSTVAIEFAGGEVGGMSLGVSSTPILNPGDRIVVFFGRFLDKLSACSGHMGIYRVQSRGGVEGRSEDVGEFTRKVAAL